MSDIPTKMYVRYINREFVINIREQGLDPTSISFPREDFERLLRLMIQALEGVGDHNVSESEPLRLLSLD